MHEIPLTGGNVTAGVVRGATPCAGPPAPGRRPLHALLRQPGGGRLRRRAACILGLDDRGREILTYAEGMAAWPWDAFAPLATDAALARVAERINAYHAAVAGFAPPPDAAWNPIAPHAPGRLGGAELICHNDFAPWNLIIGPDSALTFIDWDLAAPGARLSDLAYAARGFVPLIPDPPYPIAYTRRLALLCEVWRVKPADLIDAILWRGEVDFTNLRTRAEAGEEPWRSIWNVQEAGVTRNTRFVVETAAKWVAELS